jgi:hypothetical protein
MIHLNQNITSNQLTSQSRVVLGKLTGTHLVKKFHPFITELEGSLLHSKQHLTHPYHTTDETSSYHHSLFLYEPLNIASLLCVSLSSGLLLSNFPTRLLCSQKEYSNQKALIEWILTQLYETFA